MVELGASKAFSSSSVNPFFPLVSTPNTQCLPNFNNALTKCAVGVFRSIFRCWAGTTWPIPPISGFISFKTLSVANNLARVENCIVFRLGWLPGFKSSSKGCKNSCIIPILAANQSANWSSEISAGELEERINSPL
ncbi:Uncharacterised protein (plasmid) [Legionella adelaidensis]|uniref:Uncharacterized protein n=1 Tax=Legionella adelaidensis TaxID=45056 RepID=A0A3S4V6H1_9GAMM|nr:Uncharacterised protein [Legionella adelaidensis]